MNRRFDRKLTRRRRGRTIERLEPRVLFASISWISDVSGDFNNPANWSTGAVPTAADDVTIAVASNVVVTVSDFESVSSLTLSSPLTITAPTPGTAALSVNGSEVAISGTTLQLGSADATSSGSLSFSGFVSVGGNGGSILFAGTGSNLNEMSISQGGAGSGSRLNINGIEIHGSTGEIVAVSAVSAISSSATILEDGGGTILIQAGSSSSFVNSGSIKASTGTIDLEGAWMNSGSLGAAPGGVLDLGGTFTSGDANSISGGGGIVNIVGTLTIEGSLELTPFTGSFQLDGGTVVSGNGNTINASSGVALTLTAFGGVLDGIALGAGAPLDGSSGIVTVKDGLTLASSTLTVGAAFSFSGSQGLGGSGILLLQPNGALQAVGNGGSAPATLTIESDITVQGGSGTIAGMNAGDGIENDGTIDANAAGTGINVHGGSFGTFFNSGQMTAEGGTLNITGAWGNATSITVSAGATLNLGDQTPRTSNTWSNSGLISTANSTVNIGGDLTSAGLGNFNRSGGTVNLTGIFDPQGSTQTLSAATGSWNLMGATILCSNSTLNSSGASLVLTSFGGTLTGGLTLGPGSPIDASAGTATVIGGLTLTNTILDVGGSVMFSGTQALSGIGSVMLSGSLQAVGDGAANPATLTLGTGIVIGGSSGSILGNALGDSIVNDGTINPAGSGSTISMVSNGGTITNAGTISVAPTDAVAVNPGLITTATSIIIVGIDATGSGAIDVTGTATLAGSLNISTAPGFVPPQSMVYNVLNFNGFTGAFAGYFGLTPAMTIFTPATTPTGVTITTTFGSFTGLRPTTLTTIASEQTAALGDSITFTATVATPAGDGVTPTGTVSFFLNGVALGTAAVAADETAAFTTASLPSGRQMVTAVYSGDGMYASSASAVLGVLVQSPVETIGGLSQTFGTQGLASHPVGFTTTSGVAAAANGQSIVAGTIGVAPSESFGITRYNADGTLDTTFGTAGVTSYTFGTTDDQVSAILILSGGQLLVAGTATTYTAGVASGSQFALAEFNSDGTLDTAFGGGTGEVLTSFSTTPGLFSSDVVHALAVSPAGNIYLAGNSTAGGHGEDFAIAAYTAAGAPLTAFNATGTLTLDFAGADDSINSLALQSNGDLVAAGFATVGGIARIALARFLPSGLLDKHFGTSGTVTTNVRGVYDSASSVVIQPRGQIVIGGVSATGSGAALSADFVLARYTSAGRVDPTFGGGPVITSFGQPSAITQLVLQADGGIVASGKTTASLTGIVPAQLDVALARYTAGGALDTTFNTDGKTIIDLSGGVAAASDVSFSTTIDAILQPLDVSSLGTAFDQFIASQQGVVAVTPGGAILDAGNSGASTVEAQIITAGVDLIAGLLTTLPAAVPGGLKAAVTVNIAEDGTTIAKGLVTIDLEVATDAQGDGAQNITSFAEKINLRQAKSHAFKLAFVYPAGIPTANYFLLATVVDGSTLTDLNTNNNTALSAGKVNISPPTTVLSATQLSAFTPFVPGKSAGFSFDLTNTGNVLAHGKFLIELFLSKDQTTSGGTQVDNPSESVALAAGKSHPYRLKFILPKTATAGSFYLLALIDPTNLLGATDHSDTLSMDTMQVTVSKAGLGSPAAK